MAEGVARAEDVYTKAFFAGLKPDPIDLSVSEWADSYRYLSSRSSAEAGLWRTRRTPYLREPMDALGPQCKADRVVMMFGSQLGKTECGNNFLGYVMDLAPGPVLYVQPQLDMIKKLVRQRLDPMIAETPRLDDKVSEARAKDATNNLFNKEFPGGLLLLTGANSAASLASMPIRYLLLDEVDRYPGDVDGEGDPVNLAKARTRTFANKKILETSTPTEAGNSRIDASFEESDKRQYHVPCPECEEKQALKFSNLIWDKGQPETVSYQCEHCGSLIDEHKKTWMLENGEWIAQHPEITDVRGYHLNSLYSPLGWYSWAEIAADFEKVKGKPEQLKTFVNTVLAEVWVDRGEAPDAEALYRRRESYGIGTVPSGGLLLTAGADVQRDRIEVEIVAWGRNMESWSIDHRVYKGDTSQNDVWSKFWALLNEAFEHESGNHLFIRQLAIDSSDQTQTVYKQVRDTADDRVMAVKGQDNSVVIVGQPKDVDISYEGRKYYRGVKLWPVGVSQIKTELYGFLRQQPPMEDEETPHGFCHFPEYDYEFFKQLTAEHRVKRTRGGKQIIRWEKWYERNEALDMRVYARAAAFVFGIDRFDESHWQQLENALADAEEQSQKPASGPVIKRRKSNWL